MNIQKLVDMDDAQFEHCVSQAIKGRRDFPHWYRAILHEDVIDDTQAVVEGFIEAGERQELDPERFPAARGFVRKMHAVLAEITLERIAREEG